MATGEILVKFCMSGRRGLRISQSGDRPRGAGSMVRMGIGDPEESIHGGFACLVAGFEIGFMHESGERIGLRRAFPRNEDFAVDGCFLLGG